MLREIISLLQSMGENGKPKWKTKKKNKLEETSD